MYTDFQRLMYVLRASIRFIIPESGTITLGRNLLWHLEYLLKNKKLKSGGAIAPLAPLLTETQFLTFNDLKMTVLGNDKKKQHKFLAKRLFYAK